MNLTSKERFLIVKLTDVVIKTLALLAHLFFPQCFFQIFKRTFDLISTLIILFILIHLLFLKVSF